MPARFVESTRYFVSAKERGVELERRPVDRIVITGFSQMTPLGDTNATWQGLLEGRSAARQMDLQNWATNIGAPLPDNFDPDQFLIGKREAKEHGFSRVAKINIILARRAAQMAGILGEDGRINSSIHPNLRAAWTGSAIADTHKLINIAEKLHKIDEHGNENVVKASSRIRPSEGLEVFPEQPNGRVAILGFSGAGGSAVAACSTGAWNIAELADKMRSGKARMGVAGGVEDALYNHPEVTAAIFAALQTALSKRNHEPEKASRPFDEGRDGFVMGSGGAVVIMESLEDALTRGATIYAEVLGWSTSMDGYTPTTLNPERVADTMAEALYDKDNRALIKPDAVFVHATSTPVGDKEEAKALRLVFGDDARDIPIAAIKSVLGHLMGGAGSANVVNAIMALNTDTVPHILNLDNPDPEIMREGELYFVRQRPLVAPLETVLTTAYGFGGYNAVILLGKYKQAA